MAFIKIRNLSVTYKNNQNSIFENLNLDIPKNSITVLLGPNGSGKSTLLKSILGIIPYKGEILIENKVSIKGHSIGYVPQNFNLADEFPITVFEFLKLSLISCRHSQNEKNTMINDVLNKVQMSDFSKRLYSDLSGGQKQRVLFARALVHQPKLLVLDEPEAGIDIDGSKLIYKIMSEIVKNKKLTVLMASHELEIIDHHADNVICLNHKIVCQGKPSEVLNKKNLSSLYGGDVNLYHHRH